jgi:hypothetical protein
VGHSSCTKLEELRLRCPPYQVLLMATQLGAAKSCASMTSTLTSIDQSAGCRAHSR